MPRLVIGLLDRCLVLSLLMVSACVVEAGNAGSGTTAAGGGKGTNSSKVDIKIADDLSSAQHQIYLNVTSVTFVAAAGADSVVITSMPNKLALGVATASWLTDTDLPQGSYQAIQLSLDPKAPGMVTTQGREVPLTLKGGQHILQAAIDLTIDASGATNSLALKFSSARAIGPLDASGASYEMAPELLVLPSASLATISGTTTRREPGIACAYLYAPKVALSQPQTVPTFDLNWFSPTATWKDAIGAMAIKLAMAAPSNATLPPDPAPPFSPESDPTAPFECGNQALTKADAVALVKKNPIIAPLCHPVAMLNDPPQIVGVPPGQPTNRGMGLVTPDVAVTIVPQYALTRTALALDTAPDCAHAFLIAPVLDGQFSLQTVPGQYVFRFFFAPSEVVDGSGVVMLDAGATTEVVVP